MPNRIDQDRPVGIYGSITRDLSKMPDDPMHEVAMKLAREQGNAAFLRMATPAEGAKIEVSARSFLGWLDGSGLAGEFLRDLQGMAETDKGEPLLTSWVSWSRFWAAVSSTKGTVSEAIRRQAEDWQSLGLDEVYFDFYEKPTHFKKHLLAKRDRLYAEQVARWDRAIVRGERRIEQRRMMRRSLHPTYPNPFECCEGRWDVSRQHWSCTPECLDFQANCHVE